MRFGTYAEYWYNTYRIHKHQPQTIALMRGYLNDHIKPSALGRMEIQNAKTKDYQIFLRDMVLGGNKCGLTSVGTYGKPLSHWTVNKIRQILIHICECATREGIIPKNYAAETERAVVRKGMTPIFTPEMQRKVLAKAMNTRFYVAYVLGFFAGMRRGEILGLSWNNVNIDESILEINQIIVEEHGEPVLKKNHAKTDSSIRSIPIPFEIRDLIIDHGIHQEKEAKKEGYSNPEGLLFTKTNGAPVSPSIFSRGFKVICNSLDFPKNIHFHCTRHTWATNMLQSGAAISDVQAIGGWATPDILLKIYAHTVKDSHRKAMINMFKMMAMQGGLGNFN